MPHPDANDWPNMFPAMRYRDAPAALDWLEKVLGFERQLVVPGPNGTIAHAEMSFGSGMIMLGSAVAGAEVDGWDVRSPLDLGGATTQGVYIYLADVDAHYAKAKGAGAEITRDLADTEHGSREYTAKDPEGHLWSFGTYRPPAASKG